MRHATTRRQLVTRLGMGGAVLGVAAGLAQVAVGDRIPEWSGAKQAPVGLGLLTVALSLIGGLAALLQRRPLTILARAACALGLVGPGLICLTTVGRLWYLPSLLLSLAGILTVERWGPTFAAVTTEWMRVLLSVLAACEILMAAGAAPVPALVGGLGGVIVAVTAWARPTRRIPSRVLVALGAVPFAVVGWTAVVPVLVALESIAIALVLPTRRAS